MIANLLIGKKWVYLIDVYKLLYADLHCNKHVFLTLKKSKKQNDQKIDKNWFDEKRVSGTVFIMHYAMFAMFASRSHFINV